MRLRSLFAVPALVAGLLLAGCSSGGSSGTRQTYSNGAQPTYAQPTYPQPSRAQPTYPQPSRAQPTYAQAPAYAPRPSGNTAYIFMTNHCGFCTKLRNNTLPDGQVRAELSSLNGQEVNAESQSGRVIASRYGITGFPTTVVVNSSGAVVKKIVGYYGPNDYVNQLRQAH